MTELLEKTYDAIVVGTGPGGASVARELSRTGQHVLMLERGSNKPIRESFLGLSAMVDSVSVGESLDAFRAVTTGGTSALYFAGAEQPDLDVYASLGIDLSKALEEVKKELPIDYLSDELLGSKVRTVRDSAVALGYTWTKTLMMIDQAACTSGYTPPAKWNSRSHVDEAINNGSTLVNGAKVIRVSNENGRATGVEVELYKGRKCVTKTQVKAPKVLLCAGALATPMILESSGVTNVGADGFYCDPGFLVMATVPGLKGGNEFAGAMGADATGDIALGDACGNRTMHKLFMLQNMKVRQYFAHSKTIGIGVLLRDKVSGTISNERGYQKKLTESELAKLGQGAESAIEILRNAGGVNMVRGRTSASHVGGVLQINSQIDSSLQTQIDNLYVCDGSVIPAVKRGSPTLTLICLGKYLASRLN